MSHKLTVGLTKKIGQPDRSSLSASCHVELEIENLVQGDLDRFHERAKQIFDACRQAVNGELARQRRQSRKQPISAG